MGRRRGDRLRGGGGWRDRNRWHDGDGGRRGAGRCGGRWRRGSGGTGGDGGAAGGENRCTITATSSLAPAIPTVGIVTFTTNLTGITGAQVRFGLASTGPTLTAPVDLTQPDYRTLLLGMKASSAYVFRIVATSDAGTCTSQDYPLTTGPVPASVPMVTTTIMDAAAHARGFIITVASGIVLIIDADGAPVWWTPAVGALRAHMSWEGKDMYTLAPRNVARISMEGTNAQNNLSGLANAHHDFTAIPGGIAVLLMTGSTAAANSVVERSTDWNHHHRGCRSGHPLQPAPGRVPYERDSLHALG